MKLLLISNSTNAGEGYLEYPKQQIADFLTKSHVREVMFVPYAAVTFSYDEYLNKVLNRFDEFSIKVDSVHRHSDPANAIMKSHAIVVGGGNTFQLLKKMQQTRLASAIRIKAMRGIPYIGWSAGANVACPTICTTNDMPIVFPRTLKALNLIPFQINPHYLDANPEGHAGETREQRILEYIEANPKMYVAGLREGCMFRIEKAKMKFIGNRNVRLFKHNSEPKELPPDTDFSFLLYL
ncbi:MAG: dipeptidase PepE [Prevotellaceae bacterium]|jgi:dipeptidase E|nr:dipeptidase PepE [Prevotellaceae bacterium]